MAQWWGPKNFTNPVCELDVRPGGAWRIVMRAPDGMEYISAGVYSEVAKPERLVFTNNAYDHEGKSLLEGVTSVTSKRRAQKRSSRWKPTWSARFLTPRRCSPGWTQAGTRAWTVWPIL